MATRLANAHGTCRIAHMAAPRKKSQKNPFQVSISNRQKRHPLRLTVFRQAARNVLAGEGVRTAQISVAIVDDPTIHRLNRQFLQHDYPTDVLSFLLERDGDDLEGEIILSVDTAASSCGEFGWSVQEEATLYLIHGLLHLVGYDDHSPRDKKAMRAKEREYLAAMGMG